ncbi:Por secretion system C-terminal sorting domain-containing protein [Reichenbachiella faecimaris]|uniref:Por secretion system C-terminal sorting domain-containing protein n=1 Tax=Reichenbachiella faecimaris TaxID=692418 RepID=A0A1W2GDK1_REIFA|nr:DUF2341 domain-containing protein [Reichenbachiella faecimaris]SMD34594.1 Por secretion system C-terminal sorting domain-containing protein [Reichenbachiella faecimaris]
MRINMFRVLPLCIWLGLSINEVHAQWLADYCYRKSVTVDATQVSGSSNLSEFPVLISIIDNDLRTIANDGNVENANGDDIRITDNTHTELDIEIETFVASTGQLVIWVEVPSLDYDDNTTLYLYYGNSAASAYANPENVWDSNYLGVWHLNEATGNQVLDATVNDNDETMYLGNPGSDTYTENTTTTSIAGVVSNARSFNNVGNDGTNDISYIEIPHSASIDITSDQLTIEVWARMYYPSPEDAPFVIKSPGTNTERFMFGTQNSDNAINRRITSSEANTNNDGWNYNDVCGNNGHYRYDDAYASDADWHYFVMSYDGSDDDGLDATNLRTLIDGSLQTFSRSTATCDPYPYGNIATTTADLFFGRRVGNERFFKGAMDEIRISTVARSTDWIITTYNNVDDPSNFYAVGEQEYPLEGGTATATNSQLDINESTTITLSAYDITAALQWQSSTDNSAFSDISSENAATLSTGSLTQTTFFRVKSTLDGCDAYSTTAQVTVRATFNGTHAYRTIISVDHTQVECTSSLTDYPLLINITGDANLQQANGKVQDANGYDIIFTDASNTQLSHDLERYDGTNGDLVAWVKIPTLYCDANTEIFMYYGECGYASGDQSNTDTWSNNYNGVFHLNNDPSASGLQVDRTANGDDGTSTNFASDTRLNGQIGQAIEFDGGDDYVTFGTAPQVNGTGGRTYECWIFTQTFGANEGIFQAGDPGNNDFSLHLLNNSSENFEVETDANDDDFTFVSSTNNWRHVTLTYDNAATSTSVYYDGVLFDVISGEINTTAFALELGRYNGAEFDGYMDEFRISSVARSSEWLKTQFNNQSSPSTFYSLDSEVSEFVWTGGAGSTDWNDANNWSTCSVPSSTDDIIVPGSLGFYPVVDQNRTANYINIASGASMDLNGFDLNVTGDFKNDGAFNANNGAVIFSGSGEQNIKGVGALSFFDMEVNKPDGEIILNKNLDVTNELTLTSGIVQLNDNSMTITATGSIVGGSASSFFVTTSSSCLTQNGIGSGGRTGDVLFPIGTSSTSYTPATLNNTAGNIDDFCAYVCQGVYTNGACSGTPITYKVVNKTWQITPTFGAGLDVTVSLQWNGADQTGDFVSGNAYPSQYNGGTWNGILGTDVSGQADPYVLSATGIANFYPFGVGSDDSVLPVELLQFKGSQYQDAVELYWQTATELNNDRFEIEYSANALTFVTRGVVSGAGTSNDQQAYQFSDNQPVEGTNYYRLKQIDYNGDYAYSDIIRVEYSSFQIAAFLVYPNPSSGTFQIMTKFDLDRPVELELIDMSGKIVWAQSFSKKNKSMAFDLSHIQSGYYILKAMSGSHSSTQKLVRN